MRYAESRHDRRVAKRRADQEKADAKAEQKARDAEKSERQRIQEKFGPLVNERQGDRRRNSTEGSERILREMGIADRRRMQRRRR